MSLKVYKSKKRRSLRLNHNLDEETYTKKKIPKKIKEQVWLNYNGKIYSKKCYIDWCTNDINVFNFHVGHNVPESKGGDCSISNLRPICDRCNLSMGNNYSIDEWNCKFNSKKNYYKYYLGFLFTIGIHYTYNYITYYIKNYI
mgnify:CR=1 FL=1